METKQCPNCGATVKKSAKFCIKCGHQFTNDTADDNDFSDIGNILNDFDDPDDIENKDDTTKDKSDYKPKHLAPDDSLDTEVNKPATDSDYIICKNCGFKNLKSNIHCEYCGHLLHKQNQPSRINKPDENKNNNGDSDEDKNHPNGVQKPMMQAHSSSNASNQPIDYISPHHHGGIYLCICTGLFYILYRITGSIIMTLITGAGVLCLISLFSNNKFRVR